MRPGLRFFAVVRFAVFLRTGFMLALPRVALFLRAGVRFFGLAIALSFKAGPAIGVHLTPDYGVR